MYDLRRASARNSQIRPVKQRMPMFRRSKLPTPRLPRKQFTGPVESSYRNPYAPGGTGQRNSQSAPATQEFLRNLAEGHPAAWRQLLESISHRFYSYVYYNTHSEVDAQELLQAAFVQLAPLLMGRLQPLQTLSQLTVLIASTIYRYVIDYQRRWGAPAVTALSGRTEIDNADPFWQRLPQLSPNVRQLLLLRYLIGLTVAEVAAVTGYAPNAIIAMLRTAQQHFLAPTL
jgi:RNA polymerase sigma factor (sigma-70 family)